MKRALGVGLLLAVTLQALRWKLTTVSITGTSMEPVIHAGSVLVLWRTRKIHINDVVLASLPDPRGRWPTDRGRPNGYLIKRVTATAGQPVDMLAGPVPRDHVYLEGDNSGRSLDSRQLGACPLTAIHGRIIWPTLGRQR